MGSFRPLVIRAPYYTSYYRSDGAPFYFLDNYPRDTLAPRLARRIGLCCKRSRRLRRGHGPYYIRN